MNKYKFDKYAKKAEILEGGFMCQRGIDDRIIRETKQKMLYGINELLEFVREDGNITKIITFNVDAKGKKIFLGEGSMGSVCLGTMRTIQQDGTEESKKVAIKVLKQSDTNAQNLLCSEFLTMSNTNNLDNNNFAKLYGYIKLNNVFYIFMEYLDGIELFDYIENGIQNNLENMEEKISICVQLINSLYEFHQHGIYHRDIKINNIMVTRDNDNKIIAKYIDFGFGCKTNLTCESINYCAGTLPYLSPEFYMICITARERRNERRDLFPYCDMWALGCTLYILFVGRFLLNCENDRELGTMLKTLNQGTVDDKIRRNLKSVPEFLKNAISNLLKVNYLERKLEPIQIPEVIQDVVQPTEQINDIALHHDQI
jgi:serine/threonine protein kinase